MILHAKEIEEMKILAADICIIGAGIAGISVAREFIGSDREVIILESGDYTPNGKTSQLTTGENVGLPYYNLEDTRYRAFGGTSHIWNMTHDGSHDDIVRLRGLDSIDFEKRDWVPNSGWPIKKSELDPYYERAHQAFKIGPYRYYADYWDQIDKKPRLQFEEDRVQTTRFQFARKDVFFSDYLEELDQADNIRVILDATALQIELNEYSNLTSFIEASSFNGKTFRVEAKYFVLAQGGLETPRLMLLSNRQMTAGIGNQYDLVGRYFMEHPHLWSGIFYPSDLEFFKDYDLYKLHRTDELPMMGKLVLSEEIIRKERLLNNTVSLHYAPMVALNKSKDACRYLARAVKSGRYNGELFKQLPNLFANPGAVSYAGLRKLLGGDRKKWYQKSLKYHGFLLNSMSEQIPNPESRMMLGRERDHFGQQKIQLNWALTSQDIRNIRRFQEVLDRELRKNGLGRLGMGLKDDSIPPDIHGGFHHMGTTRMHRDPKQGVVDEHCRVHGIGNLFIAGSSVFPTVGYANPTLTICALAIRLADYHKEKFVKPLEV